MPSHELETDFDVAVVGAGPAGAGAALLLAGRGRRTLLVDREPPACFPTSFPHALAESLPPSCVKLFSRFGLHTAVANAGFIEASGNTVHWGGDAPERIEHFAGGALGLQVERGPFDSLLRGAAVARGAVHWSETTARELAGSAGEWRLVCDGPLVSRTARARWILDCSGRSGFTARGSTRHARAQRGARTLALVGVWNAPRGWSLPDWTHTFVESYSGGWAWSVPASPNRRYVTVMVDPAATKITGRARLEAAYRSELAQTCRLNELVQGAARCGRPWAREASPYATECVAEDGMLLVGDAASFVDPLSSFGVKKALASAWLASVVVDTALADSSILTPALELFALRERAIHSHLQWRAASMARAASAGHRSEFWRDRTADNEEPIGGDPDFAALRADRRVLAAFEDLKRLSNISLRRSSGYRLVPRPTVRDDRVVVEDHLDLPGVPTAVRYLRSIDLVLLSELAPRHVEVPELYDAYNRRAMRAPVPLPDFLGALSTLVALDVLTLA